MWSAEASVGRAGEHGRSSRGSCLVPICPERERKPAGILQPPPFPRAAAGGVLGGCLSPPGCPVPRLLSAYCVPTLSTKATEVLTASQQGALDTNKSQCQTVTGAWRRMRQGEERGRTAFQTWVRPASLGRRV